MADITPPHYEMYLAWESTKNPLEQAERQLEEQRRIIIKWMDDDLRSGTKYEQIKWDIKYDVVWNIGIIIYKWKPNTFYKYTNWKVEFYTNIKSVQNNKFLQFALWETWYEFQDWKLSKDWKEIPQFSDDWKVNPDFVKAIDYINLFEDMQNIFWWMKAIQNWKTLEEFDLWYFELTIISWVSRIKEVMYFASKWYIPESDFKRLLVRAIQELPNQCSDTRLYRTPKWERMWMEVTKEELDEYLKPTQWEPLITQKMYDDCLRRIELRDEKIRREEKVKSWARWKLKTERTMLDRKSTRLNSSH